MRMLSATAGLATVLLAGVGIRADDNREFGARLLGSGEVPAVQTNATGRVEIVFNEDETKLHFELAVRKGVRVTQSHIHCAPSGVNGPIVVFLAGFHIRGWDVDGTWVENATATDANVIPPPAGSTCPHVINNLRDLANAIRQGDAYVNVHSVAHPGGEIRGQLRQAHDEDH